MVIYQDFAARTPESAKKYVAEALQDSDKYVERVVCESATDRMVGRIGMRIDGEMGWLWYSVEPQSQGKGIATTAIKLLMESFSMAEYRIECHPDNTASRGVARKLGFPLIEATNTSCVFASMATRMK